MVAGAAIEVGATTATEEAPGAVVAIGVLSTDGVVSVAAGVVSAAGAAGRISPALGSIALDAFVSSVLVLLSEQT